MSMRLDSSMLSFVPFDFKKHGWHHEFESGFEYDTYDYNGKTYIVTNEMENTYAEFQKYCWEQEHMRVQNAMEQLCTPYVRLTQEMLGNEKNSVNLVPGSVFYLDDPTLKEEGLSRMVEIRVTNNGLEAYYGKQRLASSTYATKVRKENNTVKEHNIQQELADGTRNAELQEKGFDFFSYGYAVGALLDSLDKVVRFANGQLDASELGVWDEKRFKIFIDYAGIDLDYTKEFSINGQKLSFHNICMDDKLPQGQYAKLAYVGEPRDAESLGFLDTVIEVSMKERLNQLIQKRIADGALQDEKQQTIDIWQIVQEQWNKYIQDDNNAAKELLMEQLEMRNWSAFFKQRELEYTEREDEENARECEMISTYFKEMGI